jgi:hypothetical protein
VVAGEYDFSIVTLFSALTHYYENRDELSEPEEAYETARLDGERRLRAALF